MIFSDLILYGGALLLLLVGLLLSLLKYFKKKSESNLLLKIQELESLMGNTQFLYGSLNSIKHYMLSHSPMETAQYMTEFTNLLKTVSSNAKQKNISLAQEIETILLYLELEKKRLGSQFDFYKEIDAKLLTESIMVKPLFAFKQVEELIQNESQQAKMQLYFVVKKVGKKLFCEVENHFPKANFIINIPE